MLHPPRPPVQRVRSRLLSKSEQWRRRTRQVAVPSRATILTGGCENLIQEPPLTSMLTQKGRSAGAASSSTALDGGWMIGR